MSTRLQPGIQDKMLAVTVSANHRYVHMCTCHQLLTILTFIQNVSYHIQLSCLLPKRSEEDGGEVSDDKAGKPVTNASSLPFNICTSDTKLYF